MARTGYVPVQISAEDLEAVIGEDRRAGHGSSMRHLWCKYSRQVAGILPPWLDYKILLAGLGMAGLLLTLAVLVAGAKKQCDDAAPRAPDFQLLADWDHLPRWVNASDSSYGVVATDQSRCSRIGAKVMRDGGNAVDASVAVVLCLGVVNPIASGIGGGMLMTIQLSNGTAKVINAREVAPSQATSDMYEGPDKKDASRIGGLAVGVPLELKGLWRAHQDYGRMEWGRLVQPAIKLAQDGFQAHPYLVFVMGYALDVLKTVPGIRSVFLKRCGNDWRLPHVGEHCCSRPKLAAFLKQVAAVKNHAEFSALYNATAEKWAVEIQHAKGIVTAQDIKEAEPRVEEPLRVDIEPLGLHFVAPKPPSSAAIMLMALKVLAGYPDMSRDLPLAYVRLLEAMKHAFAVKFFLGDGGYAPLTSNVTRVLEEIDRPEYIEAVRKLISDTDIQPLSSYGATFPALACSQVGRPLEHGTSQASLVDREGNAVSLTTTVNFIFGAKFLSESTQVVFNNQMDDFFKPGTDSYGRRRLMGAEEGGLPEVCGMLDGHPNEIVPGKKPLSSMSPTIVSDPVTKKVVMVTGGSGGPLIIAATLQSLFRVLVLKQHPWEAISKARVFNELFDGGVPPNCTRCDFTHFENFTMGHAPYLMQQDVVDRLNATKHNMSHRIDGFSEGISQAVVSGSYLGWDGVAYVGVSDPRKDGAPFSLQP